MNATLTVRMDSDLKREFSEIVEALGLDAPTVVRMLAKQTVATRHIPLSLTLPDPESDTLAFLESVHADWGEW
ncbi:MAG: type II toxin-antitoxin system RelB/DinJ family antitoxin [Actinomycetes bacterium]|jgi:addiction module RelB/DinJ family antitoxin|nr:type II toxin-antitoxin system RelB/DinJ family antitoxin [Actinomycetes bacterium]